MASPRKASTFAYLPTINAVADVLEENAQKLKGFLFSFVGTSREARIAGSKFAPSIKMPNINKKNILRLVIPIAIFVIVVLGIFAVFGKKDNASVAGANTTTNNNDVKTTEINRNFTFPLKDSKGAKTGDFTYIIQSAELRHHIVVKGQPASAVTGRVFLIVNIKIINSLNQGLQINSRDYVRISVNNDTKNWFAADIHSDPVEAQAISTTPTRIGIAVNETDKDLKLQVGEIAGKKTIIPVSFK